MAHHTLTKTTPDQLDSASVPGGEFAGRVLTSNIGELLAGERFTVASVNSRRASVTVKVLGGR